MALPAPFDADLWRQMANLGWLSVDLPPEDGGFGTGFVETAILLEEIGRALAPVPYLPTILAIAALHRAGESALVRDLSSGQRIGAVGWERQLAVSAPQADVVVTATTDGVTVLDAAGITREPAMDLTRTVGWLEGPGRQVGDAAAAQDLLERGAVGTSALLLGGATKVLEMATQYAKDRRQFGRPIGSFQAIKHHCANMLVDVEGMRSVVYWAAWCVDEHHPDASIAASAAKAWCAEAGPRVIGTGLQIHGGVGFTWDHDLHLYLKRANLDQTTFGSSRFHLDRLATLLRSRVQAHTSLS
jgi:alkylation response protein AidB-like acyl-CoA dehydrogenase